MAAQANPPLIQVTPAELVDATAPSGSATRTWAPPQPTSGVSRARFSATIRSDVTGDKAAPSDPEPGVERIDRLAFSLAGVQLKFSVVRDGRRFTSPMSGTGGGWIVKLPDRAFRDVPANEHAMMSWAAVAGVDVPRDRAAHGR